MAWPPPIPVYRDDATPQLGVHAEDHNKISDALTELVGKWRTWDYYDDAIVTSADGFNVTYAACYTNGVMAALRVVATLTDTISVPASGDIGNKLVCTWGPQIARGSMNGQPIGTGSTGRLVSGYFNATSGAISIGAVSGQGDYMSGEAVSIGGFVLLDAA